MNNTVIGTYLDKPVRDRLSYYERAVDKVIHTHIRAKVELQRETAGLRNKKSRAGVDASWSVRIDKLRPQYAEVKMSQVLDLFSVSNMNNAGKKT